MSRRRTIIAAALSLLVLGVGTAHANFSKAVQKKFNGQIIVTESGALSTVFDNDDELIEAYKKADKKIITGVENEEGTKSWTFFVMAFMKSNPGVTEVSLDFYRVDDKKQVYAANKRLSGIDPKIALLSTRIDLSEDDGLNAGRTYIVKLTARKGKKEIVLAETKLTTK